MSQRVGSAETRHVFSEGLAPILHLAVRGELEVQAIQLTEHVGLAVLVAAGAGGACSSSEIWMSPVRSTMRSALTGASARDFPQSLRPPGASWIADAERAYLFR